MKEWLLIMPGLYGDMPYKPDETRAMLMIDY